MTARPRETAGRAAQHLGAAKDTVYRWRERKNPPEHKIGRLWQFHVFEVDRWGRAGISVEGAIEQRQKNVNRAAQRELGEYRTLPLGCFGSGK
jgi:excisionase family DNA binding protein